MSEQSQNASTSDALNQLVTKRLAAFTHPTLKKA